KKVARTGERRTDHLRVGRRLVRYFVSSRPARSRRCVSDRGNKRPPEGKIFARCLAADSRRQLPWRYFPEGALPEPRLNTRSRHLRRSAPFSCSLSRLCANALGTGYWQQGGRFWKSK